MLFGRCLYRLVVSLIPAIPQPRCHNFPYQYPRSARQTNIRSSPAQQFCAMSIIGQRLHTAGFPNAPGRRQYPFQRIVFSPDKLHLRRIQGLDRTQPGLPTKKRRLATMTRLEANSRPHCMPLATCGTVIGRNIQRHRHQDLTGINADMSTGAVISASPSTSHRPRACGSTRSRASSQNCRSVASIEAPSTRPRHPGGNQPLPPRA